MFTGLVEAVGHIVRQRRESDQVTIRLTIQSPFAEELVLGESVAVDGVCLTVIDITRETFDVQVSPTTLHLTTLGTVTTGRPVNLERSVTPSTRLGGHWVLGHVDTRGVIRDIRTDGDIHYVTIQYPPEFSRWLLPRGSITVDGVSLTLVEHDAPTFSVTIIPHTWQMTALSDWTPGQPVNLEFDVLGKYVEHLLHPYLPSTEKGKEAPR